MAEIPEGFQEQQALEQAVRQCPYLQKADRLEPYWMGKSGDHRGQRGHISEASGVGDTKSLS